MAKQLKLKSKVLQVVLRIHNEKQWKFTVRLLVYLLVFILFNMFCFSMTLDADTLFPFRYIDSLTNNDFAQLVVQPGPRFFPDWLYSWVAYQVSEGPKIWGQLVMVVNNTLLLGSIFFFLSQIYPKTKAIDLTFLSVMSIPSMHVIQVHYLEYYLFMPGTHSFLLPYVFISLGLYIMWFAEQKISASSAGLFIVLGGLLLASNQLFALALLIPLICLSFLLYIMDRRYLSFLLKTAFILFLTWLMATALGVLFQKLMPQIIWMKNDYSFFDHGFIQWISTTRLVEHLIDRQRSGYILETILIATVVALCLLYKYRKSLPNQCTLFLLYFLTALCCFIGASWLIDKSHIRYMPHIIFISPLVIWLSIYELVKLKAAKQILMAICFIGFFMGVLVIDRETLAQQKKFKSGLNQISEELALVYQKHNLSGDGFSDYWLSNSFLNHEIKLLPITKGRNDHPIGAVPWAMDVNSYWDNERGLKTPRKIQFIINYKLKGRPRWKLDEQVLNSSFGPYKTSESFSKGLYDYRVYIYDKGINMESIYKELSQYLMSYE